MQVREAGRDYNVAIANMGTINPGKQLVVDPTYPGVAEDRWGTALLTRWEPIRRHTEGPLAVAEDHFARYGGPTVFGARFVGPLRALVPLVAGTSGMAYRRFLPWNAAASIGWVTLVVTLGAVFGEPVAAALDRFGLVVTVVVVAVIFVVVARYRVRRRRAAADSPGDHH